MTNSTPEVSGTSEPVLPLIAIGCSAGSLGPLIELVRGLPADLEAAVLVCQHTTQQGRSQLPVILARQGPLPATWAAEGDPLRAGRIFVAPPGHHLFVDDHQTRLSTRPRVNRHRPSVDVLFASLARAAGAAATVVVLSGVLDDGAVGSALVDLAGGQVLVQNPETSEFSGMPRAALAAAPNAIVMTGESMSKHVVDAVRRSSAPRAGGPAVRAEPEVGMEDATFEDPSFWLPGEDRQVRLACPECGGGLTRVDLPQVSYFRCHVGHQYAPQSLVAAQAEAVEARLWSAVAALEEQASMQGYLDTLATGSADEDAPLPAFASGGARDLAARAAALREQIQRWTAADTNSASVPHSHSAERDDAS